MANKDRDNKIYEERCEAICKKNAKWEVLTGFMNWMMAGEQSNRTTYYYLVHVINFLKEVRKNIEDLTLDDYTDYARKQKKYTPSNQIGKYSAIKLFGEYLFVSGKTNKNFMTGAKRPKSKERQETIQKREKGYLTPAEIQAVITNIQNGIRNGSRYRLQSDYVIRDMAIVLMFLTTGMRSMALENLDVSDVDLENNTVIVTDKEDKVNTHIIPEETKIILEKWLKKRAELLKGSNKENETALFISNRKNRIGYFAIKTIVMKYCSTITGKHITPHKLRATYGTMLYNNTHDIEFVRQQMNHSQVTTTQNYIRGNKKANKEKAASIMGNIIGNRHEVEDLFSTGESDEST